MEDIRLNSDRHHQPGHAQPACPVPGAPELPPPGSRHAARSCFLWPTQLCYVHPAIDQLENVCVELVSLQLADAGGQG